MANLFLFLSLLWVITISATFCDSSPSFKPKSQWICIPTGIVLTIKTVEPFNGIANTVGHRSNCFKEGHGQTQTYMAIDFDDKDGNQCGVKYENQTGTYWVEVEVHEHKVLVFEHDAIFNVTCENSSMSYDPYFGFSLDLHPTPLINTSKATDKFQNAENGQNYVLHAFLELFDDSIKYLNRFQLTSCFVEGDQQNAMDIIDSNGCSTDLKLISDVEYDIGYASVKLSSINPYLKLAKLKCRFSVCDKNETCRQSCQRHWYDSALKSAKNIANWIGFNTIAANADSQEPSPPPAIIDPFISSNDKLDDRRQTIVQLFIPLQTDNFSRQPQKNVFIQRCYKILFGQCYSYDDILWLDVIIYFGLNNLFGMIALILILCYQTFEADSDSEEDDETFIRQKRSLRRVSKRRRLRSKSEEIYATIESRSLIRPPKINPISQAYDNPHITMPSFFKPPTKAIEHVYYAGSSIEENPAYIYQNKISQI